MTLFTASSLISIGILMLFVVIYGLFKGIETFARTTEFLFIFIIMFILLIFGFEFISNVYQINNLRPVLENGSEPVIKAIFPLGIMFPFGEFITFTMILPHLHKKETAFKVGIPSMFFSGLMLVVFTMKSIAILGVSEITRSEFSILVAASTINIADFIQRLDTFLILLLVCGGFIKLSIYAFCAVSGAADIFNVKKSSQLIYPICVIILLSSLWMASNHIEHRIVGFGKIPYYLHLPLHIIIPLTLLLISWIQKKIREKNGNSTT
nr:endospore germination permease [Bacillus sp. AFS088145]